LPVFHETKVYEIIPSPVAHDATTYRALPGRFELKVQKNWFAPGDSLTGLKGCYFGWAVNDAAFSDNQTAMRDVSVTASCPTNFVNGLGNFITSKYTHSSCATENGNIDSTNSKIAATDSYFRIMSVWNN